MPDKLKKLTDLINSSDLSVDEKNALCLLFKGLDDEQSLEHLIKIFTENSSWIRKFHDNFKRKQQAQINGDDKLWQKIVDEEESELKNL